MFIFFTVLLLLWLISIWKIDVSKLALDMKDLIKNTENLKDTEDVTPLLSEVWKVAKLILVYIFQMSYIFVFIIYLLNAVNVDIYKYPTYAMITIFSLGLIKSMFKKKSPKIKNDMSNELKNEIINNTIQESLDKKNSISYKVKKYIVRAYTLCYYLYMIYIVAFM